MQGMLMRQRLKRLYMMQGSPGPLMKIPLTPGQAVYIHGWARARRHLTWGDVLINEQLTFRHLTESCKIPASSLHTMQPEIGAWIKAKRAVLEDAPKMIGLWEANLIKDFQCDLADLIRMEWPAATMHQMGVGMQDLVELGMTPETMALFGFTLSGWSMIGLTRAYAENIPMHTLYRVFRIARQDVLASLK